MDLHIQILDEVKKFLESLPDKDNAKALASITMMQTGAVSTVVTRQISGSIREIKVKQHRILYFQRGDTLYFVGGFTKKSQKTPTREIENAKQIQKLISSK
ncbi:MAG: type II toxin-antitoxin system RelE/ParE family toxin [Candidatus Paceibacterota bacterium]|jgi:phage-related protein